MSNLPTDLKYAESHEWVRSDDDGNLTVGITDHAQDALGDIVFVELPEAGRTVAAGETCAVIESVKAASDIYAPVAGEIIAVNEALGDAPEAINADAWANWLFRLKPATASDVDSLLDADGYARVIAQG